MKESEISENNIIFQQDNDPKYTSRKVQKWFKEQKIKLLNWPTQSPDLSPIENTWKHLKGCLLDYESASTGIYQ